MFDYLAHLFKKVPSWLHLPESFYEIYIIRSIIKWCRRTAAALNDIGARGSDPENTWEPPRDAAAPDSRTEKQKEIDRETNF